jgi:hypothetical protein
MAAICSAIGAIVACTMSRMASPWLEAHAGLGAVCIAAVTASADAVDTFADTFADSVFDNTGDANPSRTPARTAASVCLPLPFLAAGATAAMFFSSVRKVAARNAAISLGL